MSVLWGSWVERGSPPPRWVMDPVGKGLLYLGIPVDGGEEEVVVLKTVVSSCC